MKDWILSLPIAGGIFALFGFTLKHSINGDRHPKKNDIVYKDVCKARRDSIAESLNMLADRVGEFKDDSTKRFDRLENLINEQRQQRH